MHKPLQKILMLFFVGIITGCESENSVSPVRPNILFIMADDHTSQAWGVYGGVLESIVQTPNIHRLADEGTLMWNVFCTNSICTPSRATILTGQYSHKNGVYTLADSLDPQHGNVAKELKKNGYQTAVIGKWHLKTKPAGFDYYNVLPGQGRYQNPILRDSTNWESGGNVYQGFSADVIADQSIRWLENRQTEQPFFLMCHFKATHEPFDYPERHKNLYQDLEVPEPAGFLNFYPGQTERTFPGQVLEILGERYENNGQRYPGGEFSLAGLDSVAARKKIYDKFIKDFMRSGTAIDDNIGKLLNYLDQHQLAENTVVIYTADQGYFLGEHGMFDKRIMYEEALRMPFVIRYPPEVAAGSINKDIVLNTDFAPLFLDYAGVSVPGYMQGRSFRENLNGPTPDDWRESMYYRYWLHLVRRPAHLGIRNQRYKLIWFYGKSLQMPGTDAQSTPPTWEFYDLQEDPHELNNAYGAAKYQPVIQKMINELMELKNEVGDSDQQFAEMEVLLENIPQ